MRLLILAFISEAFYDIMVFGSLSDITSLFTNQNVCFTFALGFVTMCLSDKIYESKLKCKNGLIAICFIIAAILATIFKFDYMFIGILLIYCYYMSYKIARFEKWMAVIPFMLLNMLGCEAGEWIRYLFVLVDIIVLAMYKDKHIDVNKGFKLVNQVFYPAHMCVIVLIKCLI